MTQEIYNITGKGRKPSRRLRRRFVVASVAAPIIGLAGVAGLGALVGPDQPVHAREVVVDPTFQNRPTVEYAPCTVGEANSFGHLSYCENIVGTRMTITVTNDGTIGIQKS
jgi:hypothetical protein